MTKISTDYFLGRLLFTDKVFENTRSGGFFFSRPKKCRHVVNPPVIKRRGLSQIPQNSLETGQKVINPPQCMALFPDEFW